MIIDANNTILGRLGTYAAKKALLGEEVHIVNCENSVITGDRQRIFKDYERGFSMGIHTKGPFFYRMPDRFVKRAIRGMLPHKKERGAAAFKKIRCHIGIPETLKDQKSEIIKDATIAKVPNLKYVTVKEICIHVGGKIR
ncbi:50S ribosomal protein L13 [Candidatus Woesearchaeota archaeon]|nr:50S ribosomal protein L13 [Candidatus Woesearchaeota archaeon]